MIEENENKRQDPIPKMNKMQIKREIEEKQQKRKNHVLSMFSFLLLLSSILLDEIRNNNCFIENPLVLEEKLKKCLFAIWNNSTVLAQYPQCAIFAKALMVVWIWHVI